MHRCCCPCCSSPPARPAFCGLPTIPHSSACIHCTENLPPLAQSCMRVQGGGAAPRAPAGQAGGAAGRAHGRQQGTAGQGAHHPARHRRHPPSAPPTRGAGTACMPVWADLAPCRSPAALQAGAGSGMRRIMLAQARAPLEQAHSEALYVHAGCMLGGAAGAPGTRSRLLLGGRERRAGLCRGRDLRRHLPGAVRQEVCACQAHSCYLAVSFRAGTAPHGQHSPRAAGPPWQAPR